MSNPRETGSEFKKRTTNEAQRSLALWRSIEPHIERKTPEHTKDDIASREKREAAKEAHLQRAMSSPVRAEIYDYLEKITTEGGF